MSHRCWHRGDSLSDGAVREAYFIGQNTDIANAFLTQYLQAPPVPGRGPHVAQIELSTPYAQVVEISAQHTVDYSAQQAAVDYRKRGDFILVRLKVFFTPTYAGRGDDFWRAISVGLVQKKHMAATSVDGQPLYTADRDGNKSAHWRECVRPVQRRRRGIRHGAGRSCATGWAGSACHI